MFNFLKKNNEEIGGYIKYFDLEDWWNQNYTNIQKKYITSKYLPFGINPNENILIQGSINKTEKQCFVFLTELSSWFDTKEEFLIAKPMINMAEGIFKSSNNILDLHFYFDRLISFYYKFRQHPYYYEKAKEYCIKQIEISEEAKIEFLKNKFDQLPKHKGFTQIVIIYEKEKDYKSALRYAELAMKNQWNGDWKSKSERLATKI